MLQQFDKLGCNMRLKLHSFYSHIDIFPENLGGISEQQEECFCQGNKHMRKRYEGWWHVNMMCDYCFKLNCSAEEQQSTKWTFNSPRKKIKNSVSRSQSKTNFCVCLHLVSFLWSYDFDIYDVWIGCFKKDAFIEFLNF